MTNPLDDTLEALDRIRNAVETIKTRKTVTHEEHIIQDYDKIIDQLEESASILINAVVIFRKHERAL